MEHFEDKFDGPDEVCQTFGFSKTTLWRKMKAGEFPAPKIVGGKRIWRRSQILRWFDSLEESKIANFEAAACSSDDSPTGKTEEGSDGANLDDAIQWLVKFGPGPSALGECQKKFGLSAVQLGTVAIRATEVAT